MLRFAQHDSSVFSHLLRDGSDIAKEGSAQTPEGNLTRPRPTAHGR